MTMLRTQTHRSLWLQGVMRQPREFTAVERIILERIGTLCDTRIRSMKMKLDNNTRNSAI